MLFTMSGLYYYYIIIILILLKLLILQGLSLLPHSEEKQNKDKRQKRNKRETDYSLVCSNCTVAIPGL